VDFRSPNSDEGRKPLWSAGTPPRTGECLFVQHESGTGGRQWKKVSRCGYGVTAPYDPELNTVSTGGTGIPRPTINDEQRLVDKTLHELSYDAMNPDNGESAGTFPYHAARHAPMGFSSRGPVLLD